MACKSWPASGVTIRPLTSGVSFAGVSNPTKIRNFQRHAGWAFGLAVKMLLGMPASRTGTPGFEPLGSCSGAPALLMPTSS